MIPRHHHIGILPRLTVKPASDAKELIERAIAEVNRKAQSLPAQFQDAFLADVPLNVSIANLYREYLPQLR
jgi:hypothetical protein